MKTSLRLLAVLLPASILAVPAPESTETQSAPPDPFGVAELLKETKTPPLVIPKSSITTREFERRYHEWVKRAWRPAIVRELGEKMNAAAVDKLLAWWCGIDADTDTAALLADVRKIAGADVKAPVFQFFAGELFNFEDEREQALARWEIAVEEIENQTGPALPGVVAAMMILKYDTNADYKIEQSLFWLLNSALKPEHCTEDDSPFVLHTIRSQLDDFIESRAERVVVTFRESKAPEWMRLALVGQCHIHVAWAARGGGWASSVSKDGWKKFGEHLGLAREALTKSWELRKDRPEAAAHMITVKMGESDAKKDTLRLWFDRAVGAQCDYEHAYDALTNALLPRWGGSHKMMLVLAALCAQTERFDTTIPERIDAVLAAVAEEKDDWREVFREAPVPKMLVAVRRGQLKAATTESEKTRVRELLAIDAWMAGDYTAANEAFTALLKPGAKFPLLSDDARERAETRRFDWMRAFEESRVLVSKWAKGYESVNAARLAGQFEPALKEAAGILKDDAARALPWLAGMPALIEFDRDFKKGGWVPMPLRRELWAGVSGAWQSAEKELRATGSSSDAWACVLFRGQLGARYEVRGKARLPKSITKDDWAGIGVLAGHPTEFEHGGASPWFEGYLYTEDGKDTVTHAADVTHVHDDKKRKPGPALGEDRTVNFRILRDEGRVSLWMNDKLIADKARISKDAAGDECNFGLFAEPASDKETVVFTELEARKVEAD